MTVAPVPEPLVTVDQLAAHLDVHPRTLRRWRDRGMPHYMRGATIRFRVSEVEDWLRRNGRDGEDEPTTGAAA